MPENRIAIVLAAGKGTRMKSKLPKVMHPVLGRPMIGHVVQTALDLGCHEVAIVVGYERTQIETYLRTQFPDAPLGFYAQESQRGTGDAVRSAAASYQKEHSQVAILCGDTPNVPIDTLTQAFEAQQNHDHTGVLITAIAETDTTTYGRIVRDTDQHVQRIVEYKDADARTRAIREINTGCYVFSGDFLRDNIGRLHANNAQNEYYLTDLIGIATASGKPIAALVADDIAPWHGVNTRVDLAAATAQARRVRNRHLMLEGVTLMDPTTTWIDVESTIAHDVVMEPNVVLKGRCTIGAGAYIEAGVRLENQNVAPNERVRAPHAQRQ